MAREVWARVLVVDPESALLRECEQCLRGDGYSVDLAACAEEAAVLLRATSFDLVLLAAELHGPLGAPLLQHVRESLPGRPSLILLREGGRAAAIEWLRAGADDVVEVPFEPALLRLKVRTAMQRAREQRARIRLLRGAAELTEHGGPIGHAPAFRRALAQLASFAAEPGPVLLVGERGTGRSLLAGVLHRETHRGALRREVAASLDAERLEALIEAAKAPGSLLLLELEQLPLELHAALAKASERLRRRGLRLLATACPEARAERGGPLGPVLRRIFGARCVELPPLRERPEDVPVLVSYFLELLGAARPHQGLAPDLIPVLTSMPWTGNVTELRALVEALLRHAVRGEAIGRGAFEAACHELGLGEALQRASVALHGLADLASFEPGVLPFEVEERRILVRALQVTRGHVGQAAELLQIGRATLYRKIRHFGIQKDEIAAELDPSPPR